MDEPFTDHRGDGQAGGVVSGGECLAQLGENSSEITAQLGDDHNKLIEETCWYKSKSINGST